MPLIRTIHLNQRLMGEKASLCLYEIRVYDGGFLIVARTDGEPSMADPWHAALRGFSYLRLVDEADRSYASSGSDARPGRPTTLRVDGLLPPNAQGDKGDLLTGVRELTLQVDNVLERVEGPWVFTDVAARTGPIEKIARAGGRELQLYDLVMKPDGFSVGFLQLGSYTPPFVGIRSTYNEFAPTSDRNGNTYAVAGPERIGDSLTLYMKFTPVPSPDAKLTITLERIFVSTDRIWRGTVRLP